MAAIPTKYILPAMQRAPDWSTSIGRWPSVDLATGALAMPAADFPGPWLPSFGGFLYVSERFVATASEDRTLDAVGELDLSTGEYRDIPTPPAIGSVNGGIRLGDAPDDPIILFGELGIARVEGDTVVWVVEVAGGPLICGSLSVQGTDLHVVARTIPSGAVSQNNANDLALRWRITTISLDAPPAATDSALWMKTTPSTSMGLVMLQAALAAHLFPDAEYGVAYHTDTPIAAQAYRKYHPFCPDFTAVPDVPTPSAVYLPIGPIDDYLVGKWVQARRQAITMTGDLQPASYLDIGDGAELLLQGWDTGADDYAVSTYLDPLLVPPYTSWELSTAVGALPARTPPGPLPPFWTRRVLAIEVV